VGLIDAVRIAELDARGARVVEASTWRIIFTRSKRLSGRVCASRGWSRGATSGSCCAPPRAGPGGCRASVHATPQVGHVLTRLL
jgi:hypothetical protein